MTTETLFQAIFETPTHRVFIEYLPGPDGVIFIENVTIEARPISPFAQRQSERRKPRRRSEEESAELFL